MSMASQPEDEVITLPYGREELKFKKPGNLLGIIEPNYIPPQNDIKTILKTAMDNPVGTSRLRDIVTPSDTIGIVLSDPTRNVPRQDILDMIFSELPKMDDKNITLFVAAGNHQRYDIKLLKLHEEIYSRFRIVYHNSLSEDGLEYVGKTKEGTEVRVNREFLNCRVKILTGAIKPHYFAGFSGGAKGLLPGVSSFTTIAGNHLMKTRPNARLGFADGNPVREDMEEAARIVKVNFILNVVQNHKGEVINAVAGDVVLAHREGVKWTRKVCEVKIEKKADVVIASDKPPTTIDLYQASKLVAPAGMFLRDGGSVVLAAECNDGTGPLNVVNTVIYNSGLKSYLPQNHAVYLVSSMDEKTVGDTYCRYAESVESALKNLDGADVLVLPYAGWIIPVSQ